MLSRSVVSTLRDAVDCSTPGFPVHHHLHHHLREFAVTAVTGNKGESARKNERGRSVLPVSPAEIPWRKQALVFALWVRAISRAAEAHFLLSFPYLFLLTIFVMKYQLERG